MNTSFLALALFATLSPSAIAQSVVFQDGFENGFAQWTATGFWNPTQSTLPCFPPVVPFPEGVTAAWYGNPATCDYLTGTLPNSGRLELNTWIQLPTNTAAVTLYFKSRTNSEYCLDGYDKHELHVMAQNGPDAGFTEHLCAYVVAISEHNVTLQWHERRVDLTAYRGAQVRVAFEFLSVDALSNSTLGWLVDDVRIVAEPGVPFCPSAHAPTACPCNAALGWGGGCAHSGGASATLTSGGQPSVASDSLTFTAAHMPATTTALLFQGTNPVTSTTSFGDGLMCLGGALIRIGTAPAPTGTLAWPLPGSPPLSVTGLVPGTGGDRYYQVFFRDLGNNCSADTFNLTSAQKVTWSP